MAYAKLRDDMGEQSLNAGFEERWTPKFWRRGAGNAVNDHLGDVPDSIRDQMMRHDPNQNTFLEEEKQIQLFKLFAYVSILWDPRAMRDMVPEDVWSNLPLDPEISELEVLRAELKGGQYRLVGNKHETKICQLTYTISLKRTNRDKLVVKKYRKDYFYNGPTRDIERQQGGQEEDEYIEPKLDLDIPERAQLAELLCHQPEHWSEEQISKARVEVIDLYAALCKKKETV
ncbi:Uu.00g058610.m01.CDS01 [Anthostomella pinea]|uniref:Uu.00g058610.m01.CDS01 n=1 Tax=Anthostomella pinea TaxID=933095 RepID=A0AAI8YJV9_9PEZI|nr:Uu.00g058610.m01.CDS01 [Anthostomella pinea]